ncbi:UNVERIFIED_CONTAM: hypothetical protein HDU68_003928 [Siphonaria sp. JEL0065]|nr:hypothetical protein HDU68_003928 [Siphonaria sp. JEL0065]
MSFEFEHLHELSEIPETHMAFNKDPDTLTPYLFPEIWSRIFVMACGNIKQLAKITRICQSVYFYCWKSPVAKANFYFDRYGRRQAIFMAFATQFMKYPEYDQVLHAMIQNGARYSCLDRPQACPLLKLCQVKTSNGKNSVALVKLFYGCKPFVSDEHMKYCLQYAVKTGNLETICALLQQDPASISATDVAAKLGEYSVHWNLADLIRDGHLDLAMFLSIATNPADFNPRTISFAINMKLYALAQRLIEARFIAPETKLSEQDSNIVWNELGLKNLEAVKIALGLGVTATSACLQYVAGNSESFRWMTRPIALREHKSERKELNEHVFSVIDTFVGVGISVDPICISNAAATGHLALVEYLLRLQPVQENHTNQCVVRPLAVHNAFVTRNWDLVELLLETARKDLVKVVDSNSPLFVPPAEQEEVDDNDDNNETYLETSNVPAPCPIMENDSFFFGKIPILLQAGVYKAAVYSDALTSLVYTFHDWPLEKISSCADDLFACGAVVTANALSSATYDGNNWQQCTPRFEYLLDKFVVDPTTPLTSANGFYILEEFASNHNYRDCSKPIELVLAKGIKPCVDALYSAFWSFIGSDKLAAPIEAIFKSVEPGSVAVTGFFGNFVERQYGDLEEHEVEKLPVLLELMKELGYFCSPELVENVAVVREWPRTAEVLQQFVKI